jgi:hypothetical protein
MKIEIKEKPTNTNKKICSSCGGKGFYVENFADYWDYYANFVKIPCHFCYGK